MPRQTAALPLHSTAGQLLCGISAYAFQGTNAHAIIQRTPLDGAPNSPPNTSHPAIALWQKEAHWVGPAVHILLHSTRSVAAGTSKAAVRMECRLSATPRLSYFWDHRVGGRVLFPGAGFFELSTAAIKAATGKAGAAAVGLAGASIPAPLQLPEQQQLQKAAPVVLRATIRLSSGALAVASSPAAFKQEHLTGCSAVVNSSSELGAAASVAQPASASLAALVQPALSRPSEQAASLADINNTACDGTSYFHPASLDSCLQLAAASSSSALKVPASLGCLFAADRLTVPHLAAASRQQGAATAADAPSVVDYVLADAAGGCGLGVRSLELKPLGRLPAAAAARPTAAVPAAAPAVSGTEELLYEVTWPAAEPAVVAKAGLEGAAHVQLLPCGGLATAAGAIGALQAAQLETLGGAQLTTSSVLAPLPTLAGAAGSSAGRAVDGGLAGLIRSVALEYQSQKFASLDADQLAARSTASGAGLGIVPAGAASTGPDTYGVAQRSGVQQAAALLPSKTRSAIPPFHLMPMPRGALGSLKPQPVSTTAIEPGRVVMAVKAVGVNFRCGAG